MCATHLMSVRTYFNLIAPQCLSTVRSKIKMMFTIFCVLVFALSTSAAETGSCPPTLPVKQCEAACGPQAECEAPQLCCPTSCGGSMCVDAVTQRRFTNLVKAGHCPESPGGVWVCTDTCTADSDCPRKLKCCPNRCKALTCMRAEIARK